MFKQATLHAKLRVKHCNVFAVVAKKKLHLYIEDFMEQEFNGRMLTNQTD